MERISGCYNNAACLFSTKNFLVQLLLECIHHIMRTVTQALFLWWWLMMTSFSWIINEIKLKIRKNRRKIATHSKFDSKTQYEIENKFWNFSIIMTSSSWIINEINPKLEKNRRKIATDSKFGMKTHYDVEMSSEKFEPIWNRLSYIINEVSDATWKIGEDWSLEILDLRHGRQVP